MKRIYAIVLLSALSLLYGLPGRAQVYGNEWIDVSRTYYKFKVTGTGMHRIPKATLDALGVPGTVTASQFMLHHNGQEQSIYVSAAGTLGSGDYIEFYGQMIDGSQDQELYSSNAIHANDKRSLFNDTSAYFLSYDNVGGHKRYAKISTPIPGTPPPAEPWCWATAGTYFKQNFVRGVPAINDPTFKYQFQSSVFSNAEGFVESMLPPGSTRTLLLSTPNAVAAGGNALFNTALIATSYVYNHPLKVYINNQMVVDTTYGRYETRKFNRSIAASALTNSTEVKYVSSSAGSEYDLWGIAALDIRYPRSFDVSGLDYFEFRMAASSGSRYLVFQNFNTGSGIPRLYDLTSGKWYEGNTAVAGQVRFYIDPSFTESNYVLISAGSSNYTTLGSGKSVQFIDYTNSSNQGNYVIITNRMLMQPVSGVNYIQEYRNYRSSTTGGSYNVTVADVETLYDQFGYGIGHHPLAIRRFLQYAYNTWTSKPHDVYLIGRGLLYHRYKNYNPATYNFPLVPTYGDPGSDVDFVNFGTDRQQVINIGRLSAWNAQQVGTYLNKVKAYEAAQKAPALPVAATELWKKRVLHIAGASDLVLQQGTLLPVLNANKAVIADTFYGGIVTTVAKDNTNPVDPISNDYVDSIINSGPSMITFFGHASSSGFDYNINTPENYTNAPQFPILTALGCDIAQMFELSADKTISERYVDAQNGGSIATIAADNLGFTNFHPPYLAAWYRNISKQDYGGTLGDHMRTTYNAVNAQFLSAGDYNFFFAHLESMLLQGDPAVRPYATLKPDYHVGNAGLTTTPAVVTTTADSFRINIVSYNLAKAIKDTVQVKVEHINPAGAITTTRTYSIPKLYSTDTGFVWMPLNKVADIGLNKYRVTIDANSKFDETSESNNTATLELFIYSDNLVPVYPREYGVVNQQNVTLKASTLNPFRPMGRYRMEIDTTELFNSPLKQSTIINSTGGVIKWAPGTALQDSTVYYWRATFDSAINGNYNWSNSSFIYLGLATSEGWNQSHYYQYVKDGLRDMKYGTDRQFRYNTFPITVGIYSKVMLANTGAEINQSRVDINGVFKQSSGCDRVNSMQVVVIDSLTGDNWRNTDLSAPIIGCNAPCGSRGRHLFEFSITNAAAREKARRFLEDSIPNGSYVFIKNCIFHNPVQAPTIVWVNSPGPSWMNDTLTYGSGKSLYHTFKNLGFDKIDSLTHMQPILFAYQKGNPSFPKYQAVGADSSVALAEEFTITANLPRGFMYSTVVGPATEWTSLLWRTSASMGNPVNDTSRVRIIGIDNNNIETPLYTTANRDTSLAFIPPAQYPRLRLEWESYDTLNRTSPQLDYWRVLYKPVPEAALNPAAQVSFTDSVHTGQMINFSVAIENLTPLPMDSMLVRYKVVDAANVIHTLASRRYRKLPGNDTLHAGISFDPAAYPGRNLFFVEANPDNDQPEQYHPNNLGYLPFRVVTDEQNPLIDVTFDGVHILDRDIVSPTPFIKVMLKDENEYLALDDTSLLQVSVSYPGEFNTRHRIAFDGSTCKFIPATLQNGKRNEAYIEYRPQFTQRAPQGQQNIFTLYVTGKDKSGNKSGKNTDYQVSFEVVYESSITHVLNYPNPFSTSTAFVFTLTGAQIPSQFKIQILSVTGKVVREITKAELGDIHIGRNITDYKWDGRDQYGQLLGNGVYLYRVVTAINGEDMEHRTNEGVDKFFKNGYGKMYIMR